MNRLYLIRHALADLRGSKYPDDRLRPLVPKGHKQAKRLTKTLTARDIRFDRLYSSPYTRALQTAEPLKRLLHAEGQFATTSLLTGDDYKALWRLINTAEASHVALVGHEPFLSAFCSFLLQSDRELPIRMKKASMAVLACEPTPTLRELITPRFLSP